MAAKMPMRRMTNFAAVMTPKCRTRPSREEKPTAPPAQRASAFATSTYQWSATIGNAVLASKSMCWMTWSPSTLNEVGSGLPLASFAVGPAHCRRAAGEHVDGEAGFRSDKRGESEFQVAPHFSGTLLLKQRAHDDPCPPTGTGSASSFCAARTAGTYSSSGAAAGSSSKRHAGFAPRPAPDLTPAYYATAAPTASSTRQRSPLRPVFRTNSP